MRSTRRHEAGPIAPERRAATTESSAEGDAAWEEVLHPVGNSSHAAAAARARWVMRAGGEQDGGDL